MSERKYSLHRIGPGDYLLPSNDGQTIWRIQQYEEDGSAEVELWSGKRKRLKGRYWAAYRYAGPRRYSVGRFPVADDVSEWANWEMFDSLLPSRRKAIAVALEA